MSRTSYLLMVLVVFGGLVVGSAPAARASLPYCGDICSYQASCSEWCCAVPACDAYQETTCGDWGLCEAYCEPHWVETDRVLVGAYQKKFLFYCERWVVYDVYETETNCGLGDRVRCLQKLDGVGFNIDCCYAWGCWGKKGC